MTILRLIYQNLCIIQRILRILLTVIVVHIDGFLDLLLPLIIAWLDFLLIHRIFIIFRIFLQADL